VRVPHVRQALAAAILASGLVGLALAGCHQNGLEKIPKPKGKEDAPNTGCESSQGCKVWGWCTHENGECIAKSNEQCKASKACQMGGLCSLYYGRCVAQDGDCGDSEWCDKFGLCTAEDGVCKE
jgi:hypothetical protein